MTFGFDDATGDCKGGHNSTIWSGRGQTVYLPDAGLYCAGDPSYYRQAIAEMESAGFDFTLISWNGWGDMDLDGDVESSHFVGVDRATREILGHLPTSGTKMRATLLVEPFAGRQFTTTEKQALLDYIWQTLYEQHPNAVFRVDDKPLVTSFTFSFDDTGDSRFTFRQWGDPPGADWVFVPKDEMDGLYIGRNGGVIIYPRFDLFYQWIAGDPAVSYLPIDKIVRVDPTLEEGFYDRAWEWVFQRRNQVNLVIVYAWNAWAEQATLEPTSIGPHPYGTTLLDKTRWYATRLQRREAYAPFKGKE